MQRRNFRRIFFFLFFNPENSTNRYHVPRSKEIPRICLLVSDSKIFKKYFPSHSEKKICVNVPRDSVPKKVPHFKEIWFRIQKYSKYFPVQKKKHQQNVQPHMMSIDDCASYVEKNILNHMRENYSKMFPPFRIKIHVYIFPQDSVTKSGIFQ